MYDNTNPYQFVKLASVPIGEDNFGGAFSISCLCYDQDRDVLRVALSQAGIGNIGYYLEMKLCSEVLESSSNLTEVPSYVKQIPIHEAAGSVNAIHQDKASSQVFFICDNGYFAHHIDSNTGAEVALDVKPYTSIDADANGRFMGFQPSLSSDTFLLLQDRSVFPIQFRPNGLIGVHPSKSVIKRDNNNSGMMWAVREFAPN